MFIMKKTILLLTLPLMLLVFSCKKDVPNVSAKVPDPEQYELEINGAPKYSYAYDENDYVGVSSGGNISDDFDTYLDLIPGDRQSNNMTIYLYPPPGHEREGDVIEIYIKSQKLNPWTFDSNYNTTYIAQIPFVNQYAQVNYWDDARELDCLSQNRPENMSKQVKLKRIGNLLHGEIINLQLVNHNGTRSITINKLRFQVRPSDNVLIE